MALARGVTATQLRRTVVIGGVPLTDDDGLVAIPLTPELRGSIRDGELRARLSLQRESNGLFAVSLEVVRFRDREFASLHAFALREGAGWLKYVPEHVKRIVEVHLAMYVDTLPLGAERAR
jgi:hypothetical protein